MWKSIVSVFRGAGDDREPEKPARRTEIYVGQSEPAATALYTHDPQSWVDPKDKILLIHRDRFFLRVVDEDSERINGYAGDTWIEYYSHSREVFYYTGLYRD